MCENGSKNGYRIRTFDKHRLIEACGDTTSVGHQRVKRQQELRAAGRLEKLKKLFLIRVLPRFRPLEPGAWQGQPAAGGVDLVHRGSFR